MDEFWLGVWLGVVLTFAGFCVAVTIYAESAKRACEDISGKSCESRWVTIEAGETP